MISTGRVLREEHEAKITEALTPKDEPEKLFVKRLIGLCEKILSRTATRLSLHQLLAEVHRLLDDALELLKSPDDKKFLEQVIANDAAAVAAERAVSHEPPGIPLDLPTRKSIWDPSDPDRDELEVVGPSGLLPAAAVPRITAARFFWNLHIGSVVDVSGVTVQPLTRAGAGDRATSASTTLMDAIEAELGDAYSHVVYFLCDHDSIARFDSHALDVASAPAMPSLANEISEEAGRTCIFINASWTECRRASKSQQHELDAKFFRQVDLDAHQLFPIFQRLLRDEPGDVLLLGVGSDVEAMQVMGEAVTCVMLFFLQTAFALDTTRALAFLVRDCGPLFGYPSASRLLELEVYATRHEDALRRVRGREKLTHRRFVAHCLCGESAFAVSVDAIRDAMYHQQQQCTRTATVAQQQQHPGGTSTAPVVSACTSFHPFPTPPLQPSASSLDVELMPASYDACEERLLFPLEARSRRHDQVQWAEVDIRSVERLDSLFGADVLSVGDGASAGAATGNATVSATSRDAPSAVALSSSRAGPLSSRVAAAPMLLSFRERRRRRRRQSEEPSQPLPGLVENADTGGHVGAVSALTLGLKERSYGAQPQQVQLHTPLTHAGATSSKPRKLYECELCCFPIVAVSSDHEKVAIPLFFGHKAV